MGMKSKSAHFGSGAGGISKRTGSFPFKLNAQMFGEMPKQKSQIKHIMRESEGHLVDTPHNRKIIVDITNDKKNLLGLNKHGNEVYSKTINGVQYWAYVRDGIIQNGGANFTNHRNFEETIIKKKGK